MELKLELINLSFETGRECALQTMMNICPGMLTGIPLQGVTHSLERSGLGESNGVEVGRRWGSLFGDMASPSSQPAPKFLLERKHKHTHFPKSIAQLGLSIFLLLTDLCTRPRGVGLRDCFAQGVYLWVTLNYHHNSKNFMYILLVWLHSWGMCPDSPFFVCLIMF